VIHGIHSAGVRFILWPVRPVCQARPNVVYIDRSRLASEMLLLNTSMGCNDECGLSVMKLATVVESHFTW